MGEKNLIEGILELVKNFPYSVQIIILFALVTVYKIVNSKAFTQSVLFKIQNKLGRISSRDLQYHKIFNSKATYANAINNIKFDSANKTKIFRHILRSKLDTDVKVAKSIIKNKELLKVEINALCDTMIDAAYRMIKTYEEESLNKLKLTFGQVKGKKLFDFIMNNPGGFREKRVDRLNRIISQIDGYLRTSQIFDNNVERMEYFLAEIQYALRISIFDAEKMFAELNGEIDNIINSKI